jgi:5-methylthioadenosine/S-adenosylhomocysteine deaminase
MQSVDNIIHAQWIYTGEPSQSLLENHAIVIQDGKVLDILHAELVHATYQTQEIHHYHQHLVMPGFINAHTHIGMNYFRGMSDDLALMDWLTKYIFPAEKKWLSHEFVRDASLFAMAEMIRNGTTCFNDMFYFLTATAEAAEISGMRAFIGMTVIEFPTNWAANPEDYFTKGLEFYDQYKQHPLVTPTLAPHAPYTVSDASFLRIKQLSEALNLRINLHLHETQDEIEQSMQQFQKRPIQRLHELGLLSEKLLAVHSVHLNDEDLALYQANGVHMIHCPESNMKLASGICPVMQAKKLGINIALGTDSVASNNDLDMISEMRSATFLAKVANQNPTALNATEMFAMATINGARALDCDQKTGSLKKAKAADLIAIHLDNLSTLPTYNPIAQVVYAAGRQQISDVWVAGKQLMRNQVLLTLDEEGIKEKARYWGQRITQETD